jgi:uncharacterized protein (TIGR02246 family)
METQTMTNEEAIKKNMAAFADAWNIHDAQAIAVLFTDDADFINFMGGLMQGRSQIERGHAEILQSVMRQSQMTITDTRVKFIKPDVAIVHAIWILDGQITPDGKEVPQRKGRLTVVTTQEDGNWQIVALQNTEIVTLPNFKP